MNGITEVVVKEIPMPVSEIRSVIENHMKMDLSMKSRKRELVDVRKIYAHIARKYGHPFNKIGDEIDKDHATMMHYCRMVDRHFIEPSFRELYKLLSDFVSDRKVEMEITSNRYSRDYLGRVRADLQSKIDHIDLLIAKTN